MAIPSKGLSHIRTLAGRADQVVIPYRAYMQITCLEMEKARRNAERQSASQRVAGIDTRLREIEKEKAALLQALDEPAARRARAPETRPAPRRGGGGFKIRYGSSR
jgi:hypothetical protein